MEAALQQVFNILTNPPGNLVYHIVLTFSAAGALQAALTHWSRSSFPQSRRAAIGLMLLLLVRLALFISAGAAWQGLIDERFLPPADYAATLVSLVIILWLWIFPERQRLADAATLLFCLFTGTLLALGFVWWSAQSPDLPYNGSWLDFHGEVTALVFLAIGLLALLIRRPNGWGFGLGMLLLLAAGHATHLSIVLPEGNYSGPVRLAQMAAYPLLLILPQRFPLPSADQRAPAFKPTLIHEPHHGVNPGLTQVFLSLFSEADPGKVCQAITRFVAEVTVADLCLLVSPPTEEGEILIQCGYDLIREKSLDGATLSGRSMPVIQSALARGRALRLPASSTSPDLTSLSKVLNLNRAGHLLAVPVLAEDGTALAELILLSPHSNRAWTSGDQSSVSGLATALAHLLQRNRLVATYRQEAVTARLALEAAQVETEQARRERDDLRFQLAESQEQVQKDLTQVEGLTALLAAQEEARQASPLDQANLLEGEYRLALEEIARLKTALAEARIEQTSPPIEILGAWPLEQEHNEAVASLAEDLRQPLASILNNTSFLLAESMGQLAPTQRKFLERIRVSTERLNRLLDDLIQVASPAGSVLTPLNGSTNLGAALHKAIEQTEVQRHEKQISLQEELPEELPWVPANPQALQQIVQNLLENAALTSPTGEEIFLKLVVKSNEEDQDYVLIQVGDKGGGIPAEELPSVFSPLHSGGSTISGAGKSSLELAQIKNLVEAVEGRIWVDTFPGSGSVFSILLPASNPAELASPEGNTA